MRKLQISIARDFSPNPGPRKIAHGDFSGEKFRKLLMEKLKEYDRVVVDLDGTSGFGSSFLDEAFGGLIRHENMTRDEVRRRVVIKSDMDETYLEEVEEAIRLAEPIRH